MKDYGFYGTQSKYEVIPKRNPKKAKISYWVELPEPFRYGTIQLWGWNPRMDSIVRASMARTYMKTGDQYDINVMNEERQRISERLRNEGYYFFQPGYIEFLADTTVGKKVVDIRIGLKQGIPPNALHPYKLGEIKVILKGNSNDNQLVLCMKTGLRLFTSAPRT